MSRRNKGRAMSRPNEGAWTLRKPLWFWVPFSILVPMLLIGLFSLAAGLVESPEALAVLVICGVVFGLLFSVWAFFRKDTDISSPVGFVSVQYGLTLLSTVGLGLLGLAVPLLIGGEVEAVGSAWFIFYSVGVLMVAAPIAGVLALVFTACILRRQALSDRIDATNCE